MAITGVKLAVGTGVSRSSVITQGDFSLTFDRPVLHSETADGLLMVHPNGASLTAYTPAETTLDGQLVNRCSFNVAPWFSTNGQGVDARAASYSAGKVTALPYVPQPADSVVLQDAAAIAGSNVRNGLASTWCGVQFTNALPAPNRFCGPLGWWSGKTVSTYDIDLTAKVSALPSLSMAGVDYPAVSDVISHLDRFWGLALLCPSDTSGDGYEAWIPQNTQPDGETNYGQYLSILTNAAALHLIGNVATTAEKTTILRRLVQIGLQIFEGARPGSLVLLGNGGHYQWEFVGVLSYLWARNLTSDLDNLRNTIATNVLAQPFKYTAGQVADLAPHTDAAKPCVSRQRAITAVSGTTITYVTYPGADAPRMDATGLRMKRVSDGATAIVTSVPDTLVGSGTQVATIDAQPTPNFAISDVVYFEAPWTITAGQADWRQERTDAQIFPGAFQDYRDINFWLPQVLYAHALGVWRADWDATKDYVLRSLNANDPAAGNDYPAHYAVRSQYNSLAFDWTMWQAHAATYGLS